MSSTARATGATPRPAPWRQAFLTHLNEKMDSPEFVLSSLHTAPSGSPTPFVPHARYCIFRGMWAELPENKHNDAPRNTRVYESECPTFTTDVRMEKVGEVFGSSAGHASDDAQVQGSGGGGPVEAVWWIKADDGQKVQWRMKGSCFIVGPDVESDAEDGGKESSGVRTVKSELGKRMRVVDEAKQAEWSWQRELTGHFGNVSPLMRGTFKQPPPGRPTSEPYNDKDEKMGEKVTTLDDAVARRNFRVAIIRPEHVEHLDLSDPAKARRLKYTYHVESGEWSTEETWP